MKLVIIYSRTILFPKSIPIASVNHAIDRWTLRVMFEVSTRLNPTCVKDGKERTAAEK